MVGEGPLKIHHFTICTHENMQGEEMSLNFLSEKIAGCRYVEAVTIFSFAFLLANEMGRKVLMLLFIAEDRKRILLEGS